MGFAAPRPGLSGHTRQRRAHALVARAIRVDRTRLAVLELASSSAIADVRHVADGGGVGPVERNVRADALGRIEAARLTRRIAGVVATDSIGAEVALALHGHGARIAIALLRALRSAAINAGFVAVFHAIAARNARTHDTARVCPVVTVHVDDARDAVAHGVALLVAHAPHTHGVQRRHRRAVVTALVRARVAISRRRIVVVVARNDVAIAVTNVGLAITVCRVVGDGTHGLEVRVAHALSTEPVLAIRVRGTVAAVVARHAARRAAGAAGAARGARTARAARGARRRRG